MSTKYAKGKLVQLSTNFNSTEFDCHGNGCCNETLIDSKLVDYLQKIRNHFGKPITINSGYRCTTHNKAIGGATGSRHTKGDAADISVKDIAPIEVARYAENIGILGIGLYETDKDGYFVHIDVRTTKSFWYGQGEEYRSTFQEKPSVSEKKEIYRVRKSWKDEKSQIGAYENLEYAKAACDKAGSAYHVYDSKGEQIYPKVTQQAKPNTTTTTSKPATQAKIEKNDPVKLVNNAVYDNGKAIPAWVKSLTWIVKEVKGDCAIIDKSKDGKYSINSPVNVKYLTLATKKQVISPYRVRVTADKLNFREGPGTNYKVAGFVKKNQVYTIVEEKNGWGKLKSGAGWLSLSYVKKIV